MSSAVENISIKFEVQELQLKDLRTEVTNLKEMIKAKNEENAKLKTIVKSQEILLNSVRQIVEKCSSQVGEVVSQQSTSRLLSESGLSIRTSDATSAHVTSGSSSPCLLTPSFSLKSPPIAPIIVSSYSIPSVESKVSRTNHSTFLSTEDRNQTIARHNENPCKGISSYSVPSVESKVPPTNQSTFLSTEAGNQNDAKHNEKPCNGRISSDWPVDIHGNSASNVPNLSNLGNSKGNRKKTYVKFRKARSNLLDISPLTTDGSGKSAERVMRNKKFKESEESEEHMDVEYEVDKIVSYKEKFGIKLYKVMWSLGDTTWEDEANLTNCNKAIEEFWKDQSKIKTSNNEYVRRIRFKVRCQEKDSRGEKVPGLKFLVKETCTVGELKGKYGCKLNVSVEQLVWKGKMLQDDEIVQDLDGEVLNATGLTWK